MLSGGPHAALKYLIRGILAFGRQYAGLNDDGGMDKIIIMKSLIVYMNTDSVQSTSIHLPFPFGEERVFRYEALEDILQLLIRNPFRTFTVTQLRDLTNSGSKTTTNAVNLLEQLDLVVVQMEGRRKEVQLNRERVDIPDEPLFSVPQDEFRPPVRAFVEEAPEVISSFSALVLFGSVARGTADRKSDIDLWILVEDTDELLTARREATGLADELSERRFADGTTREPGYSGERYEFEVLVESVETASNYDDEILEILREGIVLVESQALTRVKDAVFNKTEPSHE